MPDFQNIDGAYKNNPEIFKEKIVLIEEKRQFLGERVMCFSQWCYLSHGQVPTISYLHLPESQ